MIRSKDLELLVVEDNPEQAKVVRMVMGREGVGITTVPTLREALSVLQQVRFDVILLDLNLPDSSGLDTLRAVLPYTTAPVLVYSAIGEEKVLREAIVLGAHDYIVKDGSLRPEHIERAVLFARERGKRERETAATVAHERDERERDTAAAVARERGEQDRDTAMTLRITAIALIGVFFVLLSLWLVLQFRG